MNNSFLRRANGCPQFFIYIKNSLVFYRLGQPLFLFKQGKDSFRLLYISSNLAITLSWPEFLPFLALRDGWTYKPASLGQRHLDASRTYPWIISCSSHQQKPYIVCFLFHAGKLRGKYILLVGKKVLIRRNLLGNPKLPRKQNLMIKGSNNLKYLFSKIISQLLLQKGKI